MLTIKTIAVVVYLCLLFLFALKSARRVKLLTNHAHWPAIIVTLLVPAVVGVALLLIVL